MADTTLSDVIDRLRAEGQLTRNSGKNSIKTIKEILIANHKDSLADKEQAREDRQEASKQTDVLEELLGEVKKGGGAGAPDSESGGGIGGLFGGLLGGGLGGLLGGAGIGLGASAAGLGVLAFGGSALIDSIAALDAQKIKDNIGILLSIGDDLVDADESLFLEGGTLALVLTGIGASLVAFSIGTGVTAAVDYFTDGRDWAQGVKDNVATLLSIKDELGGNVNMLLDGGTFMLAMTGIGIGLTAFSLGSGVAAAVDYFSKEGWADRIKESVVSLLSIKDELGGNIDMLMDSGTFVLAMTGLGVGLAIFGAGSAVAGLSDALTNWINPNWAQSIKDNVVTLLSIKDELGDNVSFLMEGGEFALAMAGIGTGLSIFAVGTTLTAISDFFSKAGWADDIKNNAITLLSVVDEAGEDPVGKARKFSSAMAEISDGISSFAGGTFVGTLKNAGTAILEFFGAENPFDQIMQVAENADDLEKGGEALKTITEGLQAFGNLNVSGVDVDFEKMGRNLAKAIPFLQAAASGGIVEGGWFSSDVNFGPYRGPGQGGILDPDLHLPQLAMASMQMNQIFGGGVIPGIGPAGEIPDNGGPMVERLQTIQEFNSTNLGSAMDANNGMRLSGSGGTAVVNAPTIAPTNNTSVNSQTTTIDGSSLNPYNARSDENGLRGDRRRRREN